MPNSNCEKPIPIDYTVSELNYDDTTDQNEANNINGNNYNNNLRNYANFLTYIFYKWCYLSFQA